MNKEEELKEWKERKKKLRDFDIEMRKLYAEWHSNHPDIVPIEMLEVHSNEGTIYERIDKRIEELEKQLRDEKNDDK